LPGPAYRILQDSERVEYLEDISDEYKKKLSNAGTIEAIGSLSAPLKTLQLALLDTKITPLQAIHSSRAFLTNIAVELDKLYPIIRSNKWGRRDHATIAEVFTEAQYYDPEPRPAFRNLYATLNDFFAPEEWNVFRRSQRHSEPSEPKLAFHSYAPPRLTMLRVDSSH
jgi:hypothetical protein